MSERIGYCETCKHAQEVNSNLLGINDLSEVYMKDEDCTNKFVLRSTEPESEYWGNELKCPYWEPKQGAECDS